MTLKLGFHDESEKKPQQTVKIGIVRKNLKKNNNKILKQLQEA